MTCAQWVMNYHPRVPGCRLFLCCHLHHVIAKLINLCMQVLSIQQLYRISTMYWDDKYGTHSVSTDVSSYRYHDYTRLESSLSHGNIGNRCSITLIWWKLIQLSFTMCMLSVQVISNMRVLMTEDSNNAVSNSFLLDDDSRSANNVIFSFIFCII